MGHLLCYQGMLRFERGEHVEARDALSEAVSTLSAVGDARMEGLALAVLGAVEAREDRTDAARAAFEAAAGRLQQVDDRGLITAHSILRAELLLAQARGSKGDVAADLQREAHELVAAGQEHAATSDDVRYALRVFRRGVRADHITFGEASMWFQLPGEERVELQSRTTLARVLDVLVAARIATPGEPIPIDDVLERAWPDERVLPEAGRNRVKVSVNALRKLGLKDVLRHERGGYLLDPGTPVARA